ncbi:hypothetical protein KFE98_07995 [bacterium SCSIO 12741]|nr:hypothetical protein KFE98_07995 [bacterium SCSIO 12741]
MKLELNLEANSFMDFAVGKVTKGMEEQVFQEYFPAVGAVLKELEIRSLRSFAVLETNLEGIKPEQGAFTYFKNPDFYHDFMNDPRFVKVRPLRDAAMPLLNDGNMFELPQQSIELDSENEYALVLSTEHLLQGSPLMELNLAENSPNKYYDGRTLAMYPWSDEAQALLASDPDGVIVFRIRFFPIQN